MHPLLNAALLGLSHACSCDHVLQPGESLRSMSLVYMEEPLVFQGEVISVEAAEDPPQWDGDLVCDPARESCRGLESWKRCNQIHHARLKVSHGFKGIGMGEFFTYNCTQYSCGDCSPACPDVGSKILDATKPGGPSSWCSSLTYNLAFHPSEEELNILMDEPGWTNGHQVLKDLYVEKPIRSKQFQFPLHLPFKALNAYGDYDCALRAILKDVLRELKFLTQFDVYRLDAVPDGDDKTLARLQFHFENVTSLEHLEQLGAVDWAWPTLARCQLPKSFPESR